MSSLAQQLQRLAVPQTSSLFVHDKDRKSLLFDPKEAANLDKETFYALGINGLEELASIHPSFREFEKNLFSENAVDFQRAVQTKEVNERLDENVTKFLLRVSPYFSLKPAQKALEWLIYRYQIHLYNVNSLMLCILPHHESKIFVRALQLLKLDSKTATMWDWLLPIQESGVYLPRSTLINHCGTNPAFLAFICEMIPKYIKAHTLEDETIIAKQLRIIFSFYATTIIGVLEMCKITEKILSGLIPYLTKGIKSEIDEYKAASYMICAQLFSKTHLQEKLLTTLLNTICKYVMQSLLTESIICVLVMFQTQENINALPKKAFKYLTRQNRLVSILEQLAIDYDVDCLLKPLVLRLVKAGIKQSLSGEVTMDTSEDEDEPPASYLMLVREIMCKLNLKQDTTTEMASIILEAYIQYGGELDSSNPDHESVRDNLKSIVCSIETRYPASLDEAISKMRDKVEGTNEQEAIDHFLQQSVVSVKRQIVPDMDTNLFLCLNHRSEMVRIRSVQHLLRNKEKCNDAEFLSDSLLARMVDDSANVVKVVFKNCMNLGEVIINKEQLTANIFHVLKHHTDTEVIHNAIRALASAEGCDVNVCGPVLLSYLVSLNKADFSVKLLDEILSSPLANNYLPLSNLRKEWLPELKTSKNVSVVAMNIRLAEVICKTLVNSQEDAIDLVKAMYEQVQTCPFPQRLTFILCLILIKLIDGNKSKQACLYLSQVIENITLKKDDKSDVKIWQGLDVIVQGSLNSLIDGSVLPWSFYLSVLAQVINHITVPKAIEGVQFWQYKNDSSAEDEWLRLVIKLMNILLELAANSRVCQPAQQLVMNLIQTKFSEESRLKLFGLMWTEHVNNFSQDLQLSAVLQARVLQLAQIYLKSIYQLDSPVSVVVNLLIVCGSNHTTLREVALSCLTRIVDILPQTDEDSASIKIFLESVLKKREEIVNDPEYLRQCIRSIVKSKTITCSPKKKRRSLGDVKEFSTILLDVAVDEKTPVFITKSILNMFTEVDNMEVFCGCMPLLERYLSEQYTTATTVDMDCLSLILDKFTPEISTGLNYNTNELKLLTSAIQTSRKPNSLRPRVQEMAIPKITKEFYSSLPSSESRAAILNALITAWANAENFSTCTLVKHSLKHMNLYADNIIAELSCVLKTTNTSGVRATKKLKRQIEAEGEKESVFESESWKRIVIVLEAIQEKKKIEEAPKIVPVAFQLLAKMLDEEDHCKAEYTKQLILSTLYFICTRHQEEIKESGLKPEQFTLERIVQCIRTSENPQTHHQALLVLTIAAKIQPEQLLHNVMSVFTFMGANTLRQDNTYSFHVISQILENVIPVITTACEEKSKSSKVQKKTAQRPELIIGMILRIFVDAYPHIPNHRKLMLFSKLISIVGESKYLWHCLLLLVEHIGTKSKRHADDEEDEDDEENKQTGPISSNDLDFILKLATSFPVVTQIMAARTMISFVASLPVEKEEDAMKQIVTRIKTKDDLITDEAKIFNVSSHTAKQLRHFKYTTFYVLCQHLQFENFLAQVSVQPEEELLSHFQVLLESVLHYITQAAKTAELYQHKPEAKFHRVLLYKVYDLLDKVVSLLPDVMFVSVISGLMDHNLPAVQRKAMDLLNIKLHQIKENQISSQIDMLLPLVEKLIKVAEQTLIIDRKCEETAVNGQTALYSLKLLCRMFGSKDPKVFVKVVTLSSRVLRDRIENAAICATALLCIAELCSCLKIHVIEFLPLFLPQVLDMVSSDDRLLENELLTLSFATTLLCVVESLPQFLSPYLDDIVMQVCRLSKFAEDGNPQKPQLQVRVQHIRQLLATSIECRIILPCIVSSYDQLVSTNWECLVFLMSILKDKISQMKKEDLESHHNQLLQFFFNSLDFRLHYFETVGSDGVIKIEDSVIRTITSMVMKMSEASFRPMMFKVFDWATREGKRDRTLILYRLSDYLAETLRSLFIIVAGPVVNHAAEVLDTNNSSKTEEKYFGKGKINRSKQKLLLSTTLDCLSKCFLYDNEGFVTPERFEAIMPPIVDQLDNLPISGNEKAYKSRITNSLVPCIANLAVATRDDSLWRKLNYQILLKTRHTSSIVRLASLEVVDEFHKKLGDEFMSLLPETIPFLAELMEDECDEVEKKCHQVIIEMEKTLGEPLQKYF